MPCLPLSIAGVDLVIEAEQEISDLLSSRLAGYQVPHNESLRIHFERNAKLRGTFAALSQNKGRQGRAFLSTIEGNKGLPFYGSQWHPERPQFEFVEDDNINHDAHAVEAMAVLKAGQRSPMFWRSRPRRTKS